MATTIWFHPKFTITYATPIAGTIVDFSAYTIAVELLGETEAIDIGNFLLPGATDNGRTTYSATATMLWEPALNTAMQPHLRESGTVKLAPVSIAVPTEYIAWSGGFAGHAWGRYEVGQRVEVEIPLIVLSTPIWTVTGETPPP